MSHIKLLTLLALAFALAGCPQNTIPDPDPTDTTSVAVGFGLPAFIATLGMFYIGWTKREEIANRAVVEDIIDFLEIEQWRKYPVSLLPRGYYLAQNSPYHEIVEGRLRELAAGAAWQNSRNTMATQRDNACAALVRCRLRKNSPGSVLCDNRPWGWPAA